MWVDERCELVGGCGKVCVVSNVETYGAGCDVVVGFSS